MINEELISAYLDGELTAEEQTQVEQALASDARLRRLHDDLRALRNSLQAMPPQKLDAQFAERVLRAAERAKAEQHAPHHEPEVIVTSHHGDRTTVGPAQHEPLAWRVMVWTIAALAAAIMFVLFMPDRTSEIADNPLRRTSDPATVETPSAPSDQKRPEAEADKSKNAEEAFEQAGNSAKPAVEEEKLDRESGTVGRQRNAHDETLAKKQVESKRELEATGLERRSFGAAKATSHDAAGNIAGEERAEREKAIRDVSGEKTKLAGQARDLLRSRGNEEQLLVVRLEVSPEQWKDGGVDAALARHGIPVETANRRSLAIKKALQEAPDAQQTGDRPAAATEESDVRSADQETRKKVQEFAALSPGADLVYVEATVEQVEAALDELAQSAHHGLSIVTLDEATLHLRAGGDRLANDGLRSNATAAPALAQSQPLRDQSGSGNPAAEGAGGGAGKFDSIERSEKFREEGAPHEGLARPGGSFAQRITLPGKAAKELAKDAAAPPPPAPASADVRAAGPPAVTAAQNSTDDVKNFDRNGSDKHDRLERGAAADRKSQQGGTQRVRVLIMIEPKE